MGLCFSIKTVRADSEKPSPSTFSFLFCTNWNPTTQLCCGEHSSASLLCFGITLECAAVYRASSVRTCPPLPPPFLLCKAVDGCSPKTSLTAGGTSRHCLPVQPLSWGCNCSEHACGAQRLQWPPPPPRQPVFKRNMPMLCGLCVAACSSSSGSFPLCRQECQGFFKTIWGYSEGQIIWLG